MASSQSHAQEDMEGVSAAGNALNPPTGSAIEHARRFGVSAARNAINPPTGTAIEHASRDGYCARAHAATHTDPPRGILEYGSVEDGPVETRCLQVAFRKRKWWSMSPSFSQQIHGLYANGQDVSYVWRWEDDRTGTYVDPEGKSTPFNRYWIDFANKVQTNTDTKRMRSVRWVGIYGGIAPERFFWPVHRPWRFYRW